MVTASTAKANVSRETIRPIRIAVINQKGGVGKTTTAVNLAHGMAMNGQRILLFDMDPQGNATTALGVEKFTTNPSSYEFLTSKEIPPDWTATQYKDLDVYPANISLIRAELDLLQNAKGRDTMFRSALDKKTFNHDYIIFDAPPSLGLLTLNILIASDYVLVPVQCEYLALEGLTMLLETLDEIARDHNPKLELLGCVLTMVDLRTNLSQMVIKDMRSHLQNRVLTTLIPRTIRLSECPSHGKTIFDYDRWGPGARAYESLAKEVIERVPQTTAPKKRNKS
ncbi:ParA family protein [soil metagenome]